MVSDRRTSDGKGEPEGDGLYSPQRSHPFHAVVAGELSTHRSASIIKARYRISRMPRPPRECLMLPAASQPKRAANAGARRYPASFDCGSAVEVSRRRELEPDWHLPSGQVELGQDLFVVAAIGNCSGADGIDK